MQGTGVFLKLSTICEAILDTASALSPTAYASAHRRRRGPATRAEEW